MRDIGSVIKAITEQIPSDQSAFLKDLDWVSKDDIFFSSPIAYVRVEVVTPFESRYRYNNFEGWRLVDVEDGHE